MSKLEPAARRVQDALRARGVGSEVRHMSRATRTAEEAAATCGCTIGQIVKSLIFCGGRSGKPYLLLVSGANRVDEKGVAASIGEPLRRPDAQYVRDVTGFAIGGVPPLGHDTQLTTFLDETLFAYDVVWAAAGTPDAVFPIAPAQLAEATAATIIAVG